MRVYAIKPEVVDKVLGAGVFAVWQDVLDSFIEEQTRAYTNEKRFSQDWAAKLKAQLEADLAFAEKVADDYAVFLERTSMTETAIHEEGEMILDVLLLAISVLTSVNDLLDQMTALGLGVLFTSLAGARIEIEAKVLETALKALQAGLEKAKGEVTEAWIQLTINVAITGALACAGPLGWLTLSAIGVGQIVADEFLGPDTGAVAGWGSRATTALGTAASAHGEYLEKSGKVSKVTKIGGKALPVVGFLFDTYEISVGYDNVEALEKLMAKARKAHDKLIAKIGLYKGILSALAVKLEELHQAIEKRTDGWTAEIRYQLLEEMRRTGYHPRH